MYLEMEPFQLALQQAGAIATLGSYDRSRYLKGEGKTATGLDTGSTWVVS